MARYTNPYKFLLIEEHNSDRRDPEKIVLEVLRTTPDVFITAEVFSFGIRDFAPSFRKRKTVRWDRATGRRKGEKPEECMYRVKRPIAHPDEAGERAYVLTGYLKAQQMKQKGYL